MTIFQALILGIIQGLTEFLPISSSAHLVLTPFLLGWNIPTEQIFPFDVLVQIGTIVAVIIYFWKDLFNIIKAFMIGLWKRQPFSDPQSRMGWYIILATIPAGLFGILIKDVVESAFNSPIATALFLYGTACILIVCEIIGKRERLLDSLTWKDALFIGFSQVLSLFPGISRSGSTIAGGMARHLKRPDAGRFSFLMSIPVMLAAGLLSSVDLINVPNLSSFLPVILTGLITAAVVGYLSIHWLLSYLNRNSLKIFAFYCIALASITLVIAYVR